MTIHLHRRTRTPVQVYRPIMGERSHEQFDDAAIEAFVSQPAQHADEGEVIAPNEPPVAVHTTWRARLTRFFFEKKASQYSSISPRTPDGRRTKPFFFNGNGRGR